MLDSPATETPAGSRFCETVPFDRAVLGVKVSEPLTSGPNKILPV